MMLREKDFAVFSIARDFSPHPGLRYKWQGKNSGETARARLLKFMAQHPNDVVLIDLDGTRGMGSSFLDEIFGGLIRKEHWQRHQVQGRFRFKSELDPSYIDTIKDSIERAEPETAH